MRCSRRETSASKLCVLAASFVGVLASAVKLQTSLKDNQVDGPRKDAAIADIVGFVRGFKTASARRAQASNTKTTKAVLRRLSISKRRSSRRSTERERALAAASGSSEAQTYKSEAEHGPGRQFGNRRNRHASRCDAIVAHSGKA